MSFEMLKGEVQSLPAAARRKLMAFMVALEDRNTPDYAAKLAEKIDDKSSDRWLTIEHCERELGLSGESK